MGLFCFWIGYFSDPVIKYKRQIKEVFTLAYGCRGLGVQTVGKVGWWEQEADRSHPDHTQEAENTLEMAGDFWSLDAYPCNTSSSKPTPPNSACHSLGQAFKYRNLQGSVIFKPSQHLLKHVHLLICRSIVSLILMAKAMLLRAF